MASGHDLGVLIVDRRGSVVYAAGPADNPDIQRLVLDRLPEARRLGAGMFALKAATNLVVLYRASQSNVVFFIEFESHKSTLFEFVASVPFAHAIFTHFVENPFVSTVVVDDKARVRFIPPVHERFFGINNGEAVGKPVTDVIENTNLHEVVRSGKAEIGKLQEMAGVTRVVARIPITVDEKIVGAIGHVMFKEPETVHTLSRQVSTLRTEVEFYRKELSGLKRYSSYDLDQMVGSSEAVQQLKSDIVKVAPLQVPVLIVGESGTGKELAAHAIHALSPRRENQMVFVNAAALPGGLVESELFGYESGAFTGAERLGRKGKFELADKSSLFFDEVGDMPAAIQVKLLRVLQDGVFEKVGSNKPRHSDFRLICASNRNFQQMISSGEFRLDLYYRISGVTIRMPSLRERLEDIPELVKNFLVAIANRHRTTVKKVDRRVYDFLREQPWPGNVRQLLHEVERAAIFCDGPELSVQNFRRSAEPMGEVRAAEAPAPRREKIQDAIEDLEQTMIRDAMARNRGNKKKVAEELGISRTYLYRKLAGE